MNRREFLMTSVAAGAMMLAAPSAFAEDKLTILGSVPNLGFPFFVHMLNEIKAEAQAQGVNLTESDGQNSATKQTADIEAALVQKVNAIVISPLDVNALAPAIEEAVKAGVPVVTIDRRVDGVQGILAHVGADNVKGGEAEASAMVAAFPNGAKLFHLQGQPGAGPAIEEAVKAGVPVVTIDRRVDGVQGILAHVGADNVKGGEAEAQAMVAAFPNGAKLFHLQGQPGAGPAIDRNKGVHNVLDPLKDKYQIIFEQTANFARAEALSVTEAGLAANGKPDAIICANDDMALGALEACAARNFTDVKIYGFDALPEALVAVRDGKLAGTVEQFPGQQSRTAVQIAVAYAKNKTEPKEKLVLLTPIVIGKDNLDKAERLSETK